MITFRCPACSRAFRVDDSLSGKTVRCSGCRQTTVIPAVGATDDQATLPPQTPTEQPTLPPTAPADSVTLPPPAADSDATVAPSRSKTVSTDARAPVGYEIEKELGRGGMGVVYKARTVALKRSCALKMILAGVHSGSDEIERFRTEAQAIARLSHPGIVQVFEIGEHDGRPFMALEYCSGGSLDHQLRQNPLKLKEAAKLVHTLAEAMQAAHDADVIHRDLKPANVLLTRKNQPKITDFGLAKKLDEQGQTQTGSVMGTPSYMPPEQAEGKKDIGPAADIYALGAILYECITGRPPFRAATPLDTLLQVISEEPVPLRQLNRRTPVDLETIAHKCLQKDPRKRYGSAQELADDLGRYLNGEPIQARPVGRIERAVKWVRRNVVVSALAALLIVALTAGVVASILFALDATEQARLAEDQAGQLAVQKDIVEQKERTALKHEQLAKEQEQRAREKEQKAREEERQTALALEQVETTLIDGLLRPIGQSMSRLYPAEHLRNNAPLSPAEGDAFARLAEVSSDRTRLRLLEKASTDVAVAKRVKYRANQLIQSAVGLNRDQRLTAVQMLSHAPGLANEPELLLVCARLGVELEMPDPRWASKTAEALVAALGKTTDRSTQEALAQGLKVVGERLDAQEAGRITETLVTAMEKATDPSVMYHLALGFKAMSERLDTRESAFHARKAAAALVVAMGQTTVANTLDRLVQELKAVNERLDDREAAVHARKAAETLVTVMGQTTNWYEKDRLAMALKAVSERLDDREAAVHVRKAAETLVATLDVSKLPPSAQNFEFPMSGLIAISQRLDDREVSKAAEALITFMGKTSDGRVQNSLAQGLKAFAERLDAKEAGKATEALLAAISRTNDPTTLTSMAEALRALRKNINDKEAAVQAAGKTAVQAGKAAETLVAAMEKTTDPIALSSMAQAVKALSEYLDTKEAAVHTGKAVELLLAAIYRARATATDPRDLYRLAQAVNTLSKSLNDRQVAAFQTGKTVEVLLAVLDSTPHPSVLMRLVHDLQEVSELLTANEIASIAEAIITAMDRTTDPSALNFLVMGFKEVSARLDVDQAARIVETLLVNMAGTTEAAALHYLAEALKVVSARLDASEAARIATTLTAALDRTTDPSTLSYLARGLGAMSERLDAREAAKAAELLTAAMDRTTDASALNSLARGLKAMCEHPDAVKAGKATETLVAALGRTTDPSALNSLALTSVAVSGYLQTTDAIRITEALIVASGQATSSISTNSWTQMLKNVVGPLSTPDLVGILRHPLCAGLAQRAILDVLGQRCRREFRNAWHFIDWADSNGVDFLAQQP